MTDNRLRFVSQLPAEEQDTVLKLAEQFQKDLATEPAPLIESYLAQAKHLRPFLLPELIAREVQWLTEQGRAPARENYEARFAADRDAVAWAFGADRTGAAEQEPSRAAATPTHLPSSHQITAPETATKAPPKRPVWLAQWNAIPLYLRILIAMVLGVIAGLAWGERASIMEIPSQVILQLLGALAPPLILVAVTHVLMTTDMRGAIALRLAGLLLLNTLVAIFVGLAVANTLQPGKWSRLEPPPSAKAEGESPDSPWETLLKNVPRSILGPLGDRQNVIGVIVIAVAFGIALRSVQQRSLGTVKDLVEIAYQVLLTMLHWIIQLVPIGVFAIVARVIGTQGFGPIAAMGVFILAVLLALGLQTLWYLGRIRLFSWPRPWAVIRGMRDALVMAFSTGSSTATMPVTYACLTDNVGLREESASLGALVGANFNNDGTALYEAMAALFIAQLIGQDLTFGQQFTVVVTSILASVGAAGIPEAGLVTMTLVFTAVKLPVDYIALLLTVDWFLDRCRTTVNVLGDVNVSCLLDGRTAAT